MLRTAALVEATVLQAAAAHVCVVLLRMKLVLQPCVPSIQVGVRLAVNASSATKAVEMPTPSCTTPMAVMMSVFGK